ncbi:hypothetical protein SISNIDRAFT_498719 [Sistotremastrum niveocremeum HHB9708]|uniref:Transcription regulator Rua1 C-terminal domain-containing protein n=2 Tax=Sistotremastrum niveocremeum HHB9708 TaxID=1314777 RepID=A0A164MJ76_9AGAM|nr:hypothetical protein SISNIDRAFT_498719 [Sistotremastrum niveocremeum HHB9708]
MAAGFPPQSGVIAESSSESGYSHWLTASYNLHPSKLSDWVHISPSKDDVLMDSNSNTPHHIHPTQGALPDPALSHAPQIAQPNSQYAIDVPYHNVSQQNYPYFNSLGYVHSGRTIYSTHLNTPLPDAIDNHLATYNATVPSPLAFPAISSHNTSPSDGSSSQDTPRNFRNKPELSPFDTSKHLSPYGDATDLSSILKNSERIRMNGDDDSLSCLRTTFDPADPHNPSLYRPPSPKPSLHALLPKLSQPFSFRTTDSSPLSSAPPSRHSTPTPGPNKRRPPSRFEPSAITLNPEWRLGNDARDIHRYGTRSKLPSALDQEVSVREMADDMARIRGGVIVVQGKELPITISRERSVKGTKEGPLKAPVAQTSRKSSENPTPQPPEQAVPEPRRKSVPLQRQETTMSSPSSKDPIPTPEIPQKRKRATKPAKKAGPAVVELLDEDALYDSVESDDDDDVADTDNYSPNKRRKSQRNRPRISSSMAMVKKPVVTSSEPSSSRTRPSRSTIIPSSVPEKEITTKTRGSRRAPNSSAPVSKAPGQTSLPPAPSLELLGDEADAEGETDDELESTTLIDLNNASEVRIFPQNIPLHPKFPLFYRRFPIPCFIGSPMEELGKEIRDRFSDAVIDKKSLGSFNPAPDIRDLYHPRFVRGTGKTKVGLCPLCRESRERLGEGKSRWFATKVSAYNYHMQYYHGISAYNHQPFSPPVAFRDSDRPKAQSHQKQQIIEGQCHKCQEWIAMEGPNLGDAKVKEIYWWKHTVACHKGSILDGESGVYYEDSILKYIEAWEETHPAEGTQ